MSWIRKVRMLVLAFALVIGLLFVLDFGLGAAGLATPPPGQESALGYQRVWLPSFERRATRTGAEVLATADARHAFQALPVEKPLGGLRICVFGGSATAGLGLAPSATFASYLERMLRAAEPGRPVDVVNLGMVALPSSGVLHLVRDALQTLEPDLVIVYSGNNEFLEIHSRKYFENTASPLARARDAFGRSNLVRSLRQLRGGSKRPQIESSAIAEGDRRVGHREMLEHVAISETERAAILDAYEANLDAMVGAANAAGVPILLMSVAANWRWWGVEDFPAADVPTSTDPDVELPIPSQTAGLVPSAELHHALYGQALKFEAIGQSMAAGYFRAAQDADPHLRRATRSHTVRVRAVASRWEVPFVDTDRVLLGDQRFGVIGFDEFYDYVHFTPLGAARVARALADEVGALELVGDVRAAAEQVLAEVEVEAAADLDAVDVGRFIGFGFERARLSDRDLWKFDTLRTALGERTAAAPDDARAWAYLGNCAFHRLDGFDEAQAAWGKAQELAELPGLAENLERLETDPRR